MDVRLLCVSVDKWDIMIRWRGRVRYRRVGTLELLPGHRWQASIDGDTIERPKKSEALRDFLNTYVLGFEQNIP